MDWKATVDKLWQTAAIIIATIATILLLTTGIKEGESIGTGLLYTNSPYEEKEGLKQSMLSVQSNNVLLPS